MATDYYVRNNDLLTQNVLREALSISDIDLSVPLQFNLDQSSQVLTIEKILRFVPGKRLVAFAKWGDTEVVAKIFFHARQSKQSAFKDARGIKALMEANIPTPKLLYTGAVTHQPELQIILIEKIYPAKNLDELWKSKKSINDILPLMRAVTIEIATHHVLGILQHDLHMKNFLVTDQCLYSLDGNKIFKYNHPISKKVSLQYLALFLVQLGAGTTQLQSDLYQTYVKSRGWPILKRDIRYLQRVYHRVGLDLHRRYLKKIFRDCTLFKKISTFNLSIMYDREYKSAEFLQLLHHPETYFNHPDSQTLKTGRSATVIKVIVNNRPLVIKRYNIKNKWHWLRRTLRETRAENSWRLAQFLCLRGFATAKPIAFINRHFFGLRSQSYFIMEYVQGENIGDYFNHYQAEDYRIKKVSSHILTLLKSLKELRITHGDLKKTNILIHNEHPVLIDLDGMQSFQSTLLFQKAFRQDIRRFMRNWENNTTIHQLFTHLLMQKNEL